MNRTEETKRQIHGRCDRISDQGLNSIDNAGQVRYRGMRRKQCTCRTQTRQEQGAEPVSSPAIRRRGNRTIVGS